VPHPKPGTFGIWGMINNQGDRASQKLTIPILVDFIILNSFVKKNRCVVYDPM
jgi:hypothetical protein